MGRLYEKPPLVEAVCELRFHPEPDWDWTIPGLLYPKICDEFPKKRERPRYQLALDQGRDDQKRSVQGQITQWIQFLREDETALVQVGPRILTVNKLKPYDDWRSFRGLIERVWKAYREVVSPDAIDRVGLRYINRIEIPDPQVEIESYLGAVPRIPDSLPQLYASWLQRTEIPLLDDNGMLVIQTGSARETDESCSIFMLDLDLRSAFEAIQLDTVMGWIERAHSRIEEGFEACITDKTRELFQEIDHDRQHA